MPGITLHPLLIENLSRVLFPGILAFVLVFLLTPFVGRLAIMFKAVDLPASMRKKNERGYSTRLHLNPYPKLGGLAMVIGILLVLVLTGNYEVVPAGILLGILIITLLGFLDDLFEVSSTFQLTLQFLAALAVVLSGISINSITILGIPISLSLFSTSINVADYNFVLVFPGAIITIIWIVGMINVINWVGGVDALNGSITSVVLLTMLVIVLSAFGNGREVNFLLALLISVHLGSVLGVLPFNYNPGKIMYGSIGDYLNGFLLALIPMLGSTSDIRWTSALLLLGLPILDAIYVVFSRFRDHPEIRKNPTKLLSLSGYNHLHHRILASGYSKKMVVLVEVTIMSVISLFVIALNEVRVEYIGVLAVLLVILVSFTLISVQKRKAEKANKVKYAVQVAEEDALNEKKSEVVVKMIVKETDEGESDSKYIY